MLTSDRLKELCAHLGYAHFIVNSNSKKPLYIKVQEWANKANGSYWTKEKFTVCKMKLPFIQNPDYEKFENIKTKMSWSKNEWLSQDNLDKLTKLGCEYTISKDRKSIRYDKYPSPVLFDMTEDEMKAAIESGCKWRMRAENNKLLRELNVLK